MLRRLGGAFRRRRESQSDDPFFDPLPSYYGLEPPLPPLMTSAPALAARIREAIEATNPSSTERVAPRLADTPVIAWHEDEGRDLVAIVLEPPDAEGVSFTHRFDDVLEGSWTVCLTLGGDVHLLEVRTTAGPESVEFLLACRRHLGVEAP